MSLLKVLYKGKEIPADDIQVIWSNCFGEIQEPCTIERYASDYASEEVGIALAGEGW